MIIVKWGENMECFMNLSVIVFIIPILVYVLREQYIHLTFDQKRKPISTLKFQYLI